MNKRHVVIKTTSGLVSFMKNDSKVFPRVNKNTFLFKHLFNAGRSNPESIKVLKRLKI